MGGDQILGTILYFGGNFAPYQWYQCNGQILAISQNTALFSLLGTYYGGNGTSTFGLPNLQGRRVIGTGPNNQLGQFGGHENVTLTLANLAIHNHTGSVTVPANNNAATTGDPTNSYPAPIDTGGCYNPPTAGTTMSSTQLTLATAGNNIPFSNVNPLLAVTVCIAYQGVFPQRP